MKIPRCVERRLWSEFFVTIMHYYYTFFLFNLVHLALSIMQCGSWSFRNNPSRVRKLS